MNTLELDNEQLKLVQDALEIYDRLSGGQMMIALEVLTSGNRSQLNVTSDGTAAREAVEKTEQAYNDLFVGSKGHQGSYTWHGPDGPNIKAFKARAIMQTICRELAYRRALEDEDYAAMEGKIRSFDAPLPMKGVEIPKITPQFAPKSPWK